jgi:hypothetical protein
MTIAEIQPLIDNPALSAGVGWQRRARKRRQPARWVPTKHRILPRAVDGQALSEPLLVSIDVGDVAFS